MLFTIIGSWLIGGIIGGVGGAVLGAVVDWFVDEDSIVTAISEEYNNAFRLLIKQKKETAVKVGIFDDEDDLIDDIEIQSKSGISDSIYEGQVIYV